MCSFSLTPVPFSDPLSYVKSIRTLFTNRIELEHIVGPIPSGLSRIVSSFLKRANTRQQQKSVENGSIEELAWDWKFQLFIRFTAEGNIWTDCTNLFMAARLQRAPERKTMKEF